MSYNTSSGGTYPRDRRVDSDERRDGTVDDGSHSISLDLTLIWGHRGFRGGGGGNEVVKAAPTHQLPGVLEGGGEGAEPEHSQSLVDRRAGM